VITLFFHRTDQRSVDPLRIAALRYETPRRASQAAPLVHISTPSVRLHFRFAVIGHCARFSEIGGKCGTNGPKSRLIYEFRRLVPGDCKVLEAYSVSYGKASDYLPVLELLYHYFGIEDADDKAARRHGFGYFGDSDGESAETGLAGGERQI